jgi:hypothetical protein
VKYEDDRVLVDEEETVLQGVISRVTEIGRCCGMGVNVDKSKALRV